jgi:hypothetical protein
MSREDAAKLVEFVAQARAVRLEEEIERCGFDLRRRKGAPYRLSGPCPRHCGHILEADLKSQTWHCRGCRHGGGVISFAKHFGELDFVGAMRLLLGRRDTVARNRRAPHGRARR